MSRQAARQRQSRDGRFFLLLGGSDQLVGSQIARLSSLGVVILSEVQSPGFDLNSPIVRNVLRGCIAHGDVAVARMTRPLALSPASCLLEACHQANVVGFFAELSSDTTRQSLAHCANSSFAFQQVPMDMCACGKSEYEGTVNNLSLSHSLTLSLSLTHSLSLQPSRVSVLRPARTCARSRCDSVCTPFWFRGLKRRPR